MLVQAVKHNDWTLQNHHDKSSYHLMPYNVTRILLTVLSILYLLSPWFICFVTEFVPLSLSHLFHLSPSPSPFPTATTRWFSVCMSLLKPLLLNVYFMIDHLTEQSLLVPISLPVVSFYFTGKWTLSKGPWHGPINDILSLPFWRLCFLGQLLHWVGPKVRSFSLHKMLQENPDHYFGLRQCLEFSERVKVKWRKYTFLICSSFSRKRPTLFTLPTWSVTQLRCP